MNVIAYFFLLDDGGTLHGWRIIATGLQASGWDQGCPTNGLASLAQNTCGILVGCRSRSWDGLMVFTSPYHCTHPPPQKMTKNNICCLFNKALLAVWSHTLINISVSVRGRTENAVRDEDPTFGMTSPTVLDIPSFSKILLLFRSFLIFLLSISALDEDVKFWAWSNSCCCCGLRN
jgi:hypothetical protein